MPIMQILACIKQGATSCRTSVIILGNCIAEDTGVAVCR